MRSALHIIIAIAGSCAGCRFTQSTDLPAAGFGRDDAATLPAYTRGDRQQPAVIPVAYDQEALEFETDRPEQPEFLAAPTQKDLVDTPVTLADLEQLALANNPSLARAAANVNALGGKWVQAGLPPNPTIGYLGGEMGNDGAAGQQGAFLAQEFVRGGKLGRSRAVVRQEIERATHELAVQQLRVLTDVRIGFYGFVIAVHRVTLTQRLRQKAGKLAKDTAQRKQAGFAKQADVLLAESEARRLQMLVENAVREKQAIWRRLALVVGTPDLAMPQLDDQFVQGQLDAAQQINIEREQAMDQLLSENPLIAAAMAEIQRARRQVERAQVEAIPNLNVQVAVQYDDASDNAVASVQFGLPIPILNRNQGAIREAQAQLAAAQQRLRQLELAILRDFELVFVRYQNAQRRAEIEAEIRAKAEESRKLIEEERVAVEEFDWLKLLTAQEFAVRATSAYLDALGELSAAAMEIDGLLLKNSLADER